MIKKLARRFRAFMSRGAELREEKILVELGRMQARQNAGKKVEDLRDVEFQVFSQHAEDGIIQYLSSLVPFKEKFFVEFGVEDYRESNTRFLLIKDLWSGLILDAGDAHIRYLKKESWLGMSHDLRANRAFITRENINELLDQGKVPEDFGLLSIDIDGNDYWIFEAITRVKPRILVLEYNSFFGPKLSLSIPYDARFDRMRSHSSGYYFGASLKALTDLANAKGYALVGCESYGVNAFYVRREFLSGLREKSVEEAYIEYRPGAGIKFPEPLKCMAELPLIETSSLKTGKISEWFNLS